MPEAPLIAEGFYSYQIGGSERVGVDLAIEFARRGYRVVCFAFYDSEGPMRRLAESAGIRCIDFNYLTRPWGIRRFTYQLALWKMLRRERIDALHVHHVTALILSGVPAWAARVPRVVMTEHALHQLIAQRSYRRAATRYCKLADAVTVVESLQARYFHDELSVPTTKVHCIANGVRIRARDPATASAVRRELGVPNDAFVLLFAGRLDPIKDLGTLLRAVALTPPEIRSKLRVVIVGDGPARARLERECGERGLDHAVTFLGARNDVGTLLQAADAFIMTSLSEGLPMALLEAMASGVPCIATEVGGIPALFGDDAGMLVPVGDAEAIGKTIAQVVSDDGLRGRLSRQGLSKVAQQHDLDAIATRYLTLLGLPPEWPSEARSNRRA